MPSREASRGRSGIDISRAISWPSANGILEYLLQEYEEQYNTVRPTWALGTDDWDDAAAWRGASPSPAKSNATRDEEAFREIIFAEPRETLLLRNLTIYSENRDRNAVFIPTKNTEVSVQRKSAAHFLHRRIQWINNATP